MKPIVCRKRNEPIIMEVIGEKGTKVAEYVDTGDKKKFPYEMIIERVVD